MPITSVDTDPNTLTMVVVADFQVPLERLWSAYTDPRQLERFWGPPTYPATFTRHDVFAGGVSRYFMTGPEGDQYHGLWEWTEVKAPDAFTVRDMFALEDGSPNPDLPVSRMEFAFETTDAGCRVTTTTYFDSTEDLEQVLSMGMEEGLRCAMGQMDDVLADLSSFAAGAGTDLQLLSDTQVRISRIIGGDVESVWRAHTDPELIPRWQTGPDGWIMTTCEVANNVGGTYRYEWTQEDGSGGFGFTGQLLAECAPNRSVTTEAMIGMEETSVTNELTLTPVPDGTLMTLVITYPNAELRDAILATGMIDGMEASYGRLESEVLKSDAAA